MKNKKEENKIKLRTWEPETHPTKPIVEEYDQRYIETNLPF